MSRCCAFVHPTTAGPHASHTPGAIVLEGAAVPVDGTPTPDRTDLVVAGLLAWFTGVLLTGALVTIVATRVPLEELAVLLTGT